MHPGLTIAASLMLIASEGSRSTTKCEKARRGPRKRSADNPSAHRRCQEFRPRIFETRPFGAGGFSRAISRLSLLSGWTFRQRPRVQRRSAADEHELTAVELVRDRGVADSADRC